LGQWLNPRDRFTRGFSRSLEWIGVIGLWVMFLANFVDLVGAPEVSLEKIFKGIFPFLVAIIINALILMAFPKIALILPGPIK
jgi:TRAP-type mannitol/chloroaromatic compound transport system permease large subunit